MQFADQANQLLLALATNSQSCGFARFTLIFTLFSKNGHLCLQKNKMATTKIKNSRLQQNTNQWVTSQLLRPLFIQSAVRSAVVKVKEGQIYKL